MKHANRLLLLYNAIVTSALILLLCTGFGPGRKSATFDAIRVQRIDVVEPNGRLRMAISNHAKLPGIIVKGKEKPFDRPQAGMIFYNDEGTENGGLIFGGRTDDQGQVVDAGGSLSFDKYGANQVVQLLGVEDSQDRLAGLSVTDSITGTDTRRRIWVGRGDDGIAKIALSDGNGIKRLVLQVTGAGEASVSFLDDKGNVQRQLLPER